MMSENTVSQFWSPSQFLSDTTSWENSVDALGLTKLGTYLKNVVKDYSTAEAVFRRCLAVDPTMSTALLNLGSILTSVKRDYQVPTESNDSIFFDFPTATQILYVVLSCPLLKAPNKKHYPAHSRKAIMSLNQPPGSQRPGSRENVPQRPGDGPQARLRPDKPRHDHAPFPRRRGR